MFINQYLPKYLDTNTTKLSNGNTIYFERDHKNAIESVILYKDAKVGRVTYKSGTPILGIINGVMTQAILGENRIDTISVNKQNIPVDIERNVDITMPTKLSDLSDDANHRTVTDNEKSTWSGKQNVIAWKENNYDPVTNKAVTESDLVELRTLISTKNRYRDVFESLEDVTDIQAGDIVTVDSVDYIWSAKLNRWLELGDYSQYIRKGQVVNSDISNDAAIAQSKIANLTTDLGNKVDKVTGYGLISSTDVAKIHEHSNKQFLDGLSQNSLDNIASYTLHYNSTTNTFIESSDVVIRIIKSYNNVHLFDSETNYLYHLQYTNTTNKLFVFASIISGSYTTTTSSMTVSKLFFNYIDTEGSESVTYNSTLSGQTEVQEALTSSNQGSNVTITKVDGVTKISATVPTGALANKDKVSSSDLDTTLSNTINGKQEKISNNANEIMYGTGTSGSITSKTLMEDEGLVVMTSEDFNECKSKALTFKKVYNTWSQFNTRPSVTPYPVWTYDSTEKTIIQSQNTDGLVGFVSTDNYSNYDITVRCYSSGTDNDLIGLVAAYAVDGNDTAHHISFTRTTGGVGPTWCCKLDFNKVVYQTTQSEVADCLAYLGNKGTTAPGNSANWNTGVNVNGSVIRIKRVGNVISAWCSQFGSLELDESTLIEVDLDQIDTNTEIIELFKGSAKWGFCNASQPNSKYEILSGINLDQKIYEMIDGNNNYWYYDDTQDDWVKDTTKNPLALIGGSRLSYNSVTKKLFYCTGSNMIQIAAQT